MASVNMTSFEQIGQLIHSFFMSMNVVWYVVWKLKICRCRKCHAPTTQGGTQGLLIKYYEGML